MLLSTLCWFCSILPNLSIPFTLLYTEPLDPTSRFSRCCSAIDHGSLLDPFNALDPHIPYFPPSLSDLFDALDASDPFSAPSLFWTARPFNALDALDPSDPNFTPSFYQGLLDPSDEPDALDPLPSCGCGCG
jgi:hypothetical protein